MVLRRKRSLSIFPDLGLIIGVLVLFGCGYRLVVGPLVVPNDTEQVSGMRVSDDGTITYIKERLEVSLRPLTDEELNRQFSSASHGKEKSVNPYTYGDWKDRWRQSTPQRFTVFRLKVKNYTYPKMKIDPMKALLTSQNGREYSPLSLQALKEYYYPFIIGYSGGAYRRFEERKDILQGTLYTDDLIFSGQEHEGFIVFPKLADDIRQIEVRLEEIVLRYDSWGNPIETLDLPFRFQREIWREGQRSARESSRASAGGRNP